MVKTILVCALLISVLALGLYPRIDHPPVFLYKNDTLYLDFESSQDATLSIVLNIKGEKVTIESPSSNYHHIPIPFMGSFYYTIKIPTSTLLSGTLTTPSNNLRSYKILIVGDSRNDEKHVLMNIIERARKTDFLIHLGDIAYFDFEDEQWKYFFKCMSKFGKIVFTVKGNHEMPGFRYSLYLYPNYYTFRIGKVRFIVLDSNDLTNLMLLKLESYLEAYQNEGSFKIVLLHHPPFSCGKYKSSMNSFHRILKKFGIKLVISSHDHNYQRLKKDDITYLVVGGGGAPLYGVQKNCPMLVNSYTGFSYVILSSHETQISISAFSLKGEMIDHFQIHF